MNFNVNNHPTKSWGFAWRMALWVLCVAPLVVSWLALSAIEAAAAGWEAFFDSARRNAREMRGALVSAVGDMAELFGRADRPRGDTGLTCDRDPAP